MRKLTILLATIAITLGINTHTTASSAQPAGSFLANAYQAVLQARAKTLDPRQLRVKYLAWNLVCFDLRDVDCTGVAVPKVLKFKPNPLRPGLMGYYDGSDTVYIRDNIRGPALEEVLAHEMSHYLDVRTLGIRVPGPAKEICFSEKRAWAVSDAYWLRYGRPSKVVGSKWANWYKHCTQFKDEMYPPTDTE
jgi:hypothetical protein